METDLFFFPPLRTPQPMPPRPDRACFVVRVDLDGAEPPIWRHLQLSSHLTLAQLHEILQLAMGWTDSHLHHFRMGPRKLDRKLQPFLTTFDVEEEGEEGVFEGDVRLDQVIAKRGDRLFYEYDFGDGWQHTVRLEKIKPWRDGDPEAECTAGERACPPEDVGGLGGLAEVLEILAGETADKDPEWVEQILTWLPEGYDPAAFSIDETNEALSSGPLPPLEQWHPMLAELLYRVGGSGRSEFGTLVKRATAEVRELTTAETVAAVERYAVLLRTVGDGVVLTAAGYLPPRIVSSLWDELDLEDEWIGKGNREDQTLPVMELRQSATALGLVRKARGRLTVTAAGRKLADDPEALLRHIASRLPLGRGHERDAGMLSLLYTATGANWYRTSGEAGPILTRLGWAVRGGDVGHAAFGWAWPTMDVLNALVGRRSDPTFSAAVAQALLRSPT